MPPRRHTWPPSRHQQGVPQHETGASRIRFVASRRASLSRSYVAHFRRGVTTTRLIPEVTVIDRLLGAKPRHSHFPCLHSSFGSSRSYHLHSGPLKRAHVFGLFVQTLISLSAQAFGSAAPALGRPNAKQSRRLAQSVTQPATRGLNSTWRLGSEDAGRPNRLRQFVGRPGSVKSSPVPTWRQANRLPVVTRHLSKLKGLVPSSDFVVTISRHTSDMRGFSAMRYRFEELGRRDRVPRR